MPDGRTLLGTLHGATHRVPGVPAHRERAAGHQGATRHGRGHSTTTERRTHHHSPARPPRVLVAWQRSIAALFGQELR
ncbi:hypothetical protein [Actinocatenispora comari]|uniref:Uncharacterized protein n=1 Tax=Actinocatenispora comari TaxID=2807577 RepID=A0A8J4AF48_9ACTN|nr:hypothetical protein [Actinocatenispora comari]GIL30181.1 hypothetical protein NUM_54350 [Actinocatenispora comari]